MCFQRHKVFRCGHSTISLDGYCDHVARFQLHHDTCENLTTDTEHVNQFCGDDGQYCEYDDEARLKRVHCALVHHQELQKSCDRHVDELQKFGRIIAINHDQARASGKDDTVTYRAALDKWNRLTARVSDLKQQNDLMIRQLEGMATTNEYHFNNALPAAMAPGQALPSLVLPPDMPLPDTSASSATNDNASFAYGNYLPPPPVSNHQLQVGNEQEHGCSSAHALGRDQSVREQQDSIGGAFNDDNDGSFYSTSYENAIIPYSHSEASDNPQTLTSALWTSNTMPPPTQTFPVPALGGFNTIANLPIDPATGDRSGSVASLLATGLATIHAKNKAASKDAVDNPRTPVKAKRKMKKSTGARGRSSLSKGASTAANTPASTTSDFSTTTDRDKEPDATSKVEEKSKAPARRPKRKIPPVNYAEIPTDSRNVGNDNSTAATNPSNTADAASEESARDPRMVVTLRTILPKPSPYNISRNALAVQVGGSLDCISSTIHNFDHQPPYNNLPLGPSDYISPDTPRYYGKQPRINFRPARYRGLPSRFPAYTTQPATSNRLEQYPPSLPVNSADGLTTGFATPGATFQPTYNAVLGGLPQLPEVPVDPAAAFAPRRGYSAYPEPDVMDTAYTSPQSQGLDFPTPSMYQSAQATQPLLDTDYGMMGPADTSTSMATGYENMLLTSLPGCDDTPMSQLVRVTSSPLTSTSSSGNATQQFEDHSAQMVQGAGDADTNIEHHYTDADGSALTGSPDLASASFNGHGLTMFLPTMSQGDMDAEALELLLNYPLSHFDDDVFDGDLV
ncbi:hypothetical protein AMS68_001383 [Peltaster fructicola]|uniref:Uncharacterized protein n=1 Tax=Peltaster fructicola TaxID=286661 RepID=A0A6H0XMD2_9PEZI|nr:hypothetical protein AMS68_001383 [Peltaster fructicola]